MYLEKINGPADVKALNSPERTVLATEMRTALIQKLSHHGGHCGHVLVGSDHHVVSHGSGRQ